jgi:hypothetical protein
VGAEKVGFKLRCRELLWCDVVWCNAINGKWCVVPMGCDVM